ncbi:MAG: 4-(cytidine 5'-diphospho)-2-C-methyl-D-erythritol kinase [Steroidobacteraceae bacterium]|jgi:4-diphosphocytidyl-2-C-methyl-D-erythritol kinase
MTMTDLLHWWPAPAKLNLCLHVTGRRADGYHELQTVFQLISLSDQLSFELRGDGRITRLDYEGATADALREVSEDQDLCVRAARALKRRTGVHAGVGIRIRKSIPVGGGLGGGSSDAATTLVALNALWDCGLSTDELAELGMTLGADVPVFVRGHSGVGEGVGERLTPINLPDSWFLVIHPGVLIPTRDVFQAPELTRNSPVLTIPALLASGGRNDCEPVVRARYPEVAAALDWLGHFAEARLTGTGSCLFARFASAAEAEQVAARVPDVWRAYVVQGLAESPLLQSF